MPILATNVRMYVQFLILKFVRLLVRCKQFEPCFRPVHHFNLPFDHLNASFDLERVKPQQHWQRVPSLRSLTTGPIWVQKWNK